jgi:hypothetical protein
MPVGTSNRLAFVDVCPSFADFQLESPELFDEVRKSSSRSGVFKASDGIITRVVGRAGFERGRRGHLNGEEVFPAL